MTIWCSYSEWLWGNFVTTMYQKRCASWTYLWLTNADLSWICDGSSSRHQMCGFKTYFNPILLFFGRYRAKISTETHIMHTSMVVKKDTASRVLVHGSNRAKINAETIIRCRTVVNMDSRKMIMSHSTVVKKDNASCDLVHGSSRDSINAEMKMRQSTVVQDKNAAILYSRNPEKQGFQHVYKSTTTSSSCRVQEAYKLLFRSGTP
jgi:hypothetical protein